MSSANITPPDTSLAEALEKLLALVIGESLPCPRLQERNRKEGEGKRARGENVKKDEKM